MTESVKALLVKSLEELEEAELKRFQWRLMNGHECISKCEMENADRIKTVDKLVACYGPEEAVKITVDILRKIRQNHLAEQLENEHEQAQAEGNMKTSYSVGAHPKGRLGYEIKKGMEILEMLKNMYLNLVLLGGSGVGKSSTGNTILGREAFPLKKSSTSLTKAVAVESGDVCGLPVRVYDTPGYSDALREIYEKVINLQKCQSLCAFLLVLQADRFTEEDQRIVEKIEELLGEKHKDNTWLIFTREDELEEGKKTMDTVIDENEALKKLVQKYEYRFHVLNNKDRKRCGGQVKSLSSKIVQGNIQTLPQKGPKRIPTNIQDIPVSSRLSRRIVLLGKTGVGKSASGNTILRKKVFKSINGTNSVTCKSSEKHATVSGRNVSVIDTPGLFDTQMEAEQLMVEIARSVYLSCPGPHAFLIVFPVNTRFTDQEEEIPHIIEMLFGEDVLKYSIILFTHEDQLEENSVENLINDNQKLINLVGQCGGRYHVFNNRDENNIEQVNGLLEKIDEMIKQNGGGYYSNEMFEDALRFRQEMEIERARKETEENIRTKIQRENEVRRQQEEIKRQEDKEKDKEELNQREKQREEEVERMRKEIEDKNRKIGDQRSEIERLSKEKQRENEGQQQEEHQNTPDSEESGFNHFFSKNWKYYLKGTAFIAIICGFVGKPVSGAVGRVLALIIDNL